MAWKLQKEGAFMGRTVAIGIQDFETVIANNYFYVDKTGFIREWWERGDSVTLWKDIKYEHAGLFFLKQIRGQERSV